MHDATYHQTLADHPRLLATLTSNPRAQWGEKGTVLFVWRDCHCGSTVAVTVAQEKAACDIGKVARGVL